MRILMKSMESWNSGISCFLLIASLFIDAYGDLIKVDWLMHVNHPGSRHTVRTKRLINLIKRPIRPQSTRKNSRTIAKDFVSVLFFIFGKSTTKSSNVFFLDKKKFFNVILILVSFPMMGHFTIRWCFIISPIK